MNSVTLEAEQVSPLIAELQQIIAGYLKANPQLTLNALSKRCGVSEPTLRRLMKGQIRNLANVTTVVDLLMYISKENSIPKIVQKYPGVVSEYLRDNLGRACDEDAGYEYSPKLNEALKDPLKYLIYKRAAHSSGISLTEIEDMFGYVGKLCAEELMDENLLESRNGFFFAKITKYALSHDSFVKGFKATAEFIKPDKLGQMKFNNLFLNFSRSINPSAYRELIRIQQEAIRKCIRLLDDPKSEGMIPAFLLVAIDTLSKRSAAEIRSHERD